MNTDKYRDTPSLCNKAGKKSVAFSPQTNYTTERPPLVGEVSNNFFAIRGMSRGQRNKFPWPLISVF
jgi:hypothetical protein